MLLYFAGNFPQLSKIEKERKFIQRLQKKEQPYNRLITFYYPQEAEIVLKLIKEFTQPKEELITHKVIKPKMAKKLKTKSFI